MSQTAAVTNEDLEKAAGAVRGLERGESLCALCYDVLSRQAEGKSVFSGKKFVAGRAKAHGVTREAAQTPFGDLLLALERGPESNMQWAIVGALFVRGFEFAAHASAAANASGQRALVATFASHCDWLELCSPYRVMPLLDALLSAELAAQVQSELAGLVLREDAAPATPEARARNAGRIAGLAESRSPAARAALERIATSAEDTFSRTLAALATGVKPTATVAPDSVPPDSQLHGRLAHRPRASWSAFAAWVSGWAIATWVLRLLFLAVGYFTEVDIDVSGEAVRVRRTTCLLGRTQQRSEQLYPLLGLRAAQRAARFPALHFVLGAFCLACGVVFGGVFAFDAARTGDRALWLIAGALLLLGSGLDLVLQVLVPGGRSRVLLELDFGSRHNLCIGDVTIEQADALLKQLWRRFARAQGAGRALA